MLFEKGDALLQPPAVEAPLVVEAVERIQPGHQHEVGHIACRQAPRGVTSAGPRALQANCVVDTAVPCPVCLNTSSRIKSSYAHLHACERGKQQSVYMDMLAWLGE